MKTVNRDQIRGLFIGVAAGDALGKPLENVSLEVKNEKYGRVTTYVRPDGHKWFDGQEAGTWTDDTQLTLLVADSLITHKGFEVWDMALRHVEYWKREGDLGFGPTTREAIKKLASGIHHSRSGISNNPKHGVGNGISMKVAPLGAFRISPWCKKLTYANEYFDYRLKDFTLMTHYTGMAVESAFAHIMAVGYCLEHEIEDFSIVEFCHLFNSIKTLEKIPYGSDTDNLKLRLSKLFYQPIPIYDLTPQDIINNFGGGSSYVYNSLPFIYAFFLRNAASIETLYDVVNAGGDTDTNGSIVGGLLGALNGMCIFPKHLIDGLWQKDRILATADKFYETFFTEKGK